MKFVKQKNFIYIYYGCITVSKVNSKTFKLAFLDQAKEKFVTMSCQELLFYLSTLLEVSEVDVVNIGGYRKFVICPGFLCI